MATNRAIAVALAALGCYVAAFAARDASAFTASAFKNRPRADVRRLHAVGPSAGAEAEAGAGAADTDFNAVPVAKTGGAGVRSASEMMGDESRPRSLGAPPRRPPRSGTFVTEGGVTVDARVKPLRYTHGMTEDECDVDDDDEEEGGGCDFSFFDEEEGGYAWGSEGAIERLVDLLDHRRGALLASSYEFPGR